MSHHRGLPSGHDRFRYGPAGSWYYISQRHRQLCLCLYRQEPHWRRWWRYPAEYRGYDSAGIATIAASAVHLYKDKGKVADVIEKCNTMNLPGHTGIGHVRWATHGGVTRENAHPHCDALSQIAVIHNGIIENYEKLKSRLSKKYEFKSDTDTEVIPHLIREQIDAGLDFEEAFFAAIKQLEGSYAIIAISTLADGKLFAARKDSPMVLGIGKGSNFIGSDVLSFLPYTREAVYIEDNECIVMTKKSYKIYDFNHREKKRMPVNITWELSEAGKGNYPHYMIKEINEQPAVIRQALMQDDRQINRMAIDILRSHQVIFVACGTSRYAALIGRYVFSRIGHTFSDVVMASEFGYFSDSVDKNTLVIAISQSGETADVMDGVKQAKSKGATVYSIVNVEGSSLARMSDKTLYLSCGTGNRGCSHQIIHRSALYVIFTGLRDGWQINRRQRKIAGNLCAYRERPAV